MSRKKKNEFNFLNKMFSHSEEVEQQVNNASTDAKVHVPTDTFICTSTDDGCKIRCGCCCFCVRKQRYYISRCMCCRCACQGCESYVGDSCKFIIIAWLIILFIVSIFMVNLSSQQDIWLYVMVFTVIAIFVVFFGC
jgi:hypothetical protein